MPANRRVRTAAATCRLCLCVCAFLFGFASIVRRRRRNGPSSLVESLAACSFCIHASSCGAASENNQHERIIDRFRIQPAINEMNTYMPPRRHRRTNNTIGLESGSGVRTELVNLKVCLARSHILPFGKISGTPLVFGCAWTPLVLNRCVVFCLLAGNGLVSVVRVRARALICQILHAIEHGCCGGGSISNAHLSACVWGMGNLLKFETAAV